MHARMQAIVGSRSAVSPPRSGSRHRRERTAPRIAIIGAGFGGLALARALQRARSGHVLVFEKEPALEAVWVGGPLHVPSAELVLTALGLAKQSETLHAASTQPGYLLHQELRLTLAESLQRGTLQCGRRVVGVERDGERLRVELDGGAETFDLVVVASGMASPLVARAALPLTAAIGDVRWAQGRWWDFGATRIRYGADRALREAIELGDRLRHGVTGDLGRFAASRRRWPAGRGEIKPTDPRACLGLLGLTIVSILGYVVTVVGSATT